MILDGRLHPDGLKVKSRVQVGLSPTLPLLLSNVRVGDTSGLAVTRPEPHFALKALDSRLGDLA